VDTHVAATPAVAAPSVSLDLGAVAAAPSHELRVGRWPGWSRLAILIGGSAILWAGLGWVAFRVLKLG
jgi:hypothetical protein